MKIFSHLVFRLCVACAICIINSCASERTITTSRAETDLGKFAEGHEIGKDTSGMSKSTSTRVSHFDRKTRNLSAKDFAGKDYHKASYRKKRWGGNTNFASKSYSGNTDGSRFQHSPYYVTSNYDARANGQYAAANQSKFHTNKFAGVQSRPNEARANAFKTGTSGYVESRHTAAPRIISKQDYRKLGVNDAKALLGR